MSYQFTLLWTDALLFLLFFAVLGFIIIVRRHEYLRAPWKQVMHKHLGAISIVVLLAYVFVGLLDSIHFHPLLKERPAQSPALYSSQTVSLLDILLKPLGENEEKTYSAPFALYSYTKEIQGYPRLQYAGQHLKNLQDKTQNIIFLAMKGFLEALLIGIIFFAIMLAWLKYKRKTTFSKSFVLWPDILITSSLIFIFVAIALNLSTEYHILGTDKVGQDIFYESLKSIRTGLIIGTLTTLFMLPFAVILGCMAGYFGGWVDDIIQYLYTTLSSIPAVLLVTAAILSLQVFISNHPEWFPNLSSWADARLLALCAILGVTSWTYLCRLLRGETLKLRELDYAQAALAMGVGHFKIITRHILPNVAHIILITVVIDFSGLVLAEAVLSYVGVGVDPTTISWGNMINSARLELAREPIVWWPLLSAFIFMFGLVLTANFFADAVRDAFDPRLRVREYG